MQKKLLTVALTGDIMLGRLVDQYIVQNLSLPPETIWGNVLPLLLEADLRLGNLECVISDKGKKWQPLFKAFHFRSSPRAIEILRTASFDCVTLANNHVLDYGPEAFLDYYDHLADDGMLTVGRWYFEPPRQAFRVRAFTGRPRGSSESLSSPRTRRSRTSVPSTCRKRMSASPATTRNFSVFTWW